VGNARRELMAGSIKPIRRESAPFLVGGTRKRQGVVLLYRTSWLR
jgi:hypothetical protein